MTSAQKVKTKIKNSKVKSDQKEIKLFAVMGVAMKRWLRPHWKIMTGALASNFIVGLTTGAFPVIIQSSVNILFDPKSIVPVYMISGAIFVLLIVRAAFTYIGNFLRTYVAQRITTSVHYDLFKYFILTDFPVIGAEHSGRLVASFMNEARQVNMLIGATLVGLTRNIITLIGVFAGMIYINWQLSLFFIVFVPALFYFMQFYGKLARSNFENVMSKTGDINRQIVETSRGAKIIRAYGTEQRELKNAKKQINELLRNILRVQRAQSASGPSAEAIISIGMALLFLYVGIEGRAGNFSQGDLIGFITAVLLIYQPLKAVAGLQTGIQVACAATNRVIQRLDVVSHIVSLPNAPKLKIKKNYKGNRILFRDVLFKYPKTNVSVLNRIGFEISAGKIAALVGHSGGGKSTIFNLLERFYDIDEGEILIDGQNVRKINLQSLRRSISLVLQDVFLFDDTITKNIAYAKAGASKKEIIKAAKISNAHEFIERLPQGYNTIVGEGGANLSGGQRQRIAFARAALRDAPILLLDEPTSALDSQSEKAVQRGMKQLTKNRTVIIIAHRLSTIQNADKILVVQKGRIVETGNHQSLIKKSSAYAKLYQAQFTSRQAKAS